MHRQANHLICTQWYAPPVQSYAPVQSYFCASEGIVVYMCWIITSHQPNCSLTPMALYIHTLSKAFDSCCNHSSESHCIYKWFSQFYFPWVSATFSCHWQPDGSLSTNRSWHDKWVTLKRSKASYETMVWYVFLKLSSDVFVTFSCKQTGVFGSVCLSKSVFCAVEQSSWW